MVLFCQQKDVFYVLPHSPPPATARPPHRPRHLSASVKERERKWLQKHAEKYFSTNTEGRDATFWNEIYQTSA